MVGVVTFAFLRSDQLRNLRVPFHGAISSGSFVAGAHGIAGFGVLLQGFPHFGTRARVLVLVGVAISGFEGTACEQEFSGALTSVPHDVFRPQADSRRARGKSLTLSAQGTGCALRLRPQLSFAVEREKIATAMRALCTPEIARF